MNKLSYEEWEKRFIKFQYISEETIEKFKDQYYNGLNTYDEFKSLLKEEYEEYLTGIRDLSIKVLAAYRDEKEKSVYYDEECLAASIRVIADELQYNLCLPENDMKVVVVKHLYKLADTLACGKF